MAYYSIQGSGLRWFWCVWQTDINQKPDHSGYSTSKDNALVNVRSLAQDAQKVTSEHAKRWRGITPVCKCGSTTMTTGAGKGQHFASLLCSACGAFQKWISFDQYQQIESVRRVG